MSTIVQQELKKKDNKSKKLGIYMKNMITRRVSLPMNKIGKNIKPILEKIISSQIDGKCAVEGYIKPGSINILTYSNGILNGENITFEVVFECLVCSPVEGMHIDAIAKNITKAGIRAETNEDISPVVIFIARDHHYKSEHVTYFSSIKENDNIKIRVIGQRYELNDKYISVIGELIKPKEQVKQVKKKPRLILEN